MHGALLYEDTCKQSFPLFIGLFCTNNTGDWDLPLSYRARLKNPLSYRALLKSCWALLKKETCGQRRQYAPPLRGSKMQKIEALVDWAGCILLRACVHASACVCVCVCVWERERMRERNRKRVCVRERKRERVSLPNLDVYYRCM